MSRQSERQQGARHETQRVRHELKRRRLAVAGVEQVTPRMRRVHFTSPDLADFRSAAPDDHIKLFFASGGGEPVMRDYTPRAFDNAAQTLAIDFVLHAAGPATEWAANVQVGQSLDIGGPRGSFIVPDDFDWYLSIGDESALPAIGRHVEALRPEVPVTTVATIVDGKERQTFATRAQWQARWIERGEDSARDAELLRDTVRDLELPAGDGYIWIAGEAAIAETLRAYFVEARGHPEAWIKAAAYWHRNGHRRTDK